MKAKGATEHQIQKAWFQWWNMTYGSPLAWAIPNGGARHIVTATKLRAEGVRAGVPDVFIAKPRHPWHGLFLEFKTEKGRVSDSQEFMLQILEDQGYKTAVVRSVDEAIKVTNTYFGR